MSALYFYCDLKNLSAQQNQDVYGPIPGFLNSRFRVTNLHRASQDVPAYTCVASSIIAMASDTPDKLNLYLKPLWPFRVGDFQVEIMVYRGILKSSLLDSSGLNLLGGNQNDLIASCHEALASVNQARSERGLGTLASISAEESLGLGKFVSTFDLDQFLSGDTPDFSPLVLKAGASIGKFSGAGFSVQFGFSKAGSLSSLVRSNVTDVFIDLGQVNASSGSADLQKNYLKEEIHHFCDTLSLYSAFAGHEVQAYENGQLLTLTPDTFMVKIGSRFPLADTFSIYLKENESYYQSTHRFTAHAFEIGLGAQNISLPLTTNGWPLLKTKLSSHFTVNESSDSLKGVFKAPLQAQNPTVQFKCMGHYESNVFSNRVFELRRVSETVQEWRPLDVPLPVLNVNGTAQFCPTRFELQLNHNPDFWYAESADPVPQTFPDHPLSGYFKPFILIEGIQSGDSTVQFRAYDETFALGLPGFQSPALGLFRNACMKDNKGFGFLVYPVDLKKPSLGQSQSSLLFQNFSMDGNKTIFEFFKTLNPQSLIAPIFEPLPGAAASSPYNFFSAPKNPSAQFNPSAKGIVLYFSRAEFDLLEQAKTDSQFVNPRHCRLSFKIKSQLQDSEGRKYSQLDVGLLGWRVNAQANLSYENVPVSIQLKAYL